MAASNPRLSVPSHLEETPSIVMQDTTDFKNPAEANPYHTSQFIELKQNLNVAKKYRLIWPKHSEIFLNKLNKSII